MYLNVVCGGTVLQAGRKVMGSVPDGIIGIFPRFNPSSCTMAQGQFNL